MATWLLCIAAAYLIGSVPFGVLIARSRGVDIRSVGSRNIGASNVGRTLGRRFGVLCFALDALKGALPALAAGIATGSLGRSPAALSQEAMWWWMAVAAAAVIGHMFSIFLRFGGGKGVATGFGGIVAMYPLLTWPALIAIAIWFIMVKLTRYVSLASMLAAASLPLAYVATVMLGPGDATQRSTEAAGLAARFDLLRHASPPLFGTLVIAVLVVIRHRSNIGRLLRGEEPRVRSGKP